MEYWSSGLGSVIDSFYIKLVACTDPCLEILWVETDINLVPSASIKNGTSQDTVSVFLCILTLKSSSNM